MTSSQNVAKNLQNNLLSIELQYFPCINAMRDIVDCKLVFFDNDLLFRRSSFRNRMILPGGNGLVSMTIPVVGGRSVKLPFKAVEIDYTSNWQRDHFRSMETIYGNSPFYFQYSASLMEIYEQKPQYLVDWNSICLDWVVKKMKINLILLKDANQLTENQEKKERIDYYSPSNHDNSGKGPFIKYPQLFEDRIGFKPNVSIVDLLFNLGPDALKKITIHTKPL